MSPTSRRGLAFVSLLALVIFGASFRGSAATGSLITGIQETGTQNKADKPLYNEYRGVRIGMEANEARKKLGTPSDKSDTQDFYVFSEKESAQVYYDKGGKVMAVSVNYVGENSGAPLPKIVLGTDIEAKADGAMHKLIRYPEAGYWVSYNRTGGGDPLITVTMQRIQ